MVKTDRFQYNQTFKLESGASLPGFQLQYSTLGKLNKEKNNVIWVCHALTGNSDFTEWWSGLFGKGLLYDPEKHFVICANMLGSCYGSTGPLSVNPLTGKPFFHDFPLLTNRDIVNSFDLLRQHLGIKNIHTLIGGSMGGQHALEWSIMHPERVNYLVQIASNARHSAWGIAFNEAQRMAIENDASWQTNTPEAGMNGMRAARAVALLSYRNYHTYEKTQSEDTDGKLEHFRASSYQRYQGDKLYHRFNAYTYWTLSRAMDSHNVGRGRGGVLSALQSVKARSLFVGVRSDVLFPLHEQEFLARHISNASLAVIDSDYGHDGFLIEVNILAKCIEGFYARESHIVPE